MSAYGRLGVAATQSVAAQRHGKHRHLLLTDLLGVLPAHSSHLHPALHDACFLCTVPGACHSSQRVLCVAPINRLR